MEKLGLDISVFQRGINFDTIVSSGIEFLILRAGFTGKATGINYNKDSEFELFYSESKKRGIPVGAYWYSCANTYDKGVAEANYMYENCLRGKQFEYPIYIDVEENKYQTVGKELVTDAIIGFCETLENKGYYVGIYANSNYFKNYMNIERLRPYDKWFAYWTNDANKPSFPLTGEDYGLWQYGDDIRIANTNIDGDRCYRDYPTIMKNKGLNGFIKNITVVNPEPITTSETIYIVVKGDNLSKIAKKYNTTWQKIYEDNKLTIGSNPSLIKIGQRLVIK